MILALVAGCNGDRVHPTPADAAAADLASTSNPDDGTTCQPDAPAACDGNAVRTCRADGSGWDTKACPEGSTTCRDGTCICPPGTRSCDGQKALVCTPGGVWRVDTTCSADTQCASGACVLPTCSSSVAASNNPHALPIVGWPRFRHDNRNTGATSAVIGDKPQLQWKVFVGGNPDFSTDGLASGPVVNPDGAIFILAGADDGMMGAFYSFDAAGKKRFTFDAQSMGGVSTPAVRVDGTAFFSTQVQEMANRLFAVDAMGKELWRYGIPTVANSGPMVTFDGTIVFGCNDSTVYALDPDGKRVWTTSEPGLVLGGLAESCDGRIYVGGEKGFFALDPKTGKTSWSVDVGGIGALTSSPVLDLDGNMYGFDLNGVGWKIDGQGKVLWKKPIGPPNGGPSAAHLGQAVYTVLGDGNLYAIDAATGNVLWHQPVGNAMAPGRLAGPVIDGRSRIYFNSTDGFVYAFDATGKQLWKIAASGKGVDQFWAGQLAISQDGTLYVPGNDGNLYAFK